MLYSRILLFIHSKYESESVRRSVVSDSLRRTDYSSAGFSVHKNLQAKILEWVAISFSRGSSQAWNQMPVSRNYSCFKFPVSDYQHPCHTWVWLWILLCLPIVLFCLLLSLVKIFLIADMMYWLTSFSFGQTLLRRTECSDVVQNGYSYSLPAGSKRGFVSSSHHEILVELLEVKLKKVWGLPYDWHSLRFLTLILAYIEPLAICQLQFRFSYPGTGSCRGSAHSFPALSGIFWFSVSTCLPLQLWGSSLPCDLPSFTSKWNLLIFVCLAFLLLLGVSGNFQAAYMPDQTSPFISKWPFIAFRNLGSSLISLLVFGCLFNFL